MRGAAVPVAAPLLAVPLAPARFELSRAFFAMTSLLGGIGETATAHHELLIFYVALRSSEQSDVFFARIGALFSFQHTS
jgi:hypothetical protein